jgi:hypothetical protein
MWKLDQEYDLHFHMRNQNRDIISQRTLPYMIVVVLTVILACGTLFIYTRGFQFVYLIYFAILVPILVNILTNAFSRSYLHHWVILLYLLFLIFWTLAITYPKYDPSLEQLLSVIASLLLTYLSIGDLYEAGAAILSAFIMVRLSFPLEDPLGNVLGDLLDERPIMNQE